MSGKKKKNPGIFETARNINENEKKQAEQKKLQAAKAEKVERENYERRLEEDKVELLKLKQGVISNSERLREEADEKKHYSVWQKIRNFIYHNKWWLGFTVFFAAIAAFLVYDTVTTTKADVMLMVLSNDDELAMHYSSIEKYFNDEVDDYNDDGKKCADLLYIPISDNEEANNMGMYESNLNKLASEFQMGETMLVLADSKSAELIMAEDTLVNLEELYPDNPNIKGYGFYLKNTEFASLIGYTEGNIPDDLYIGIRKVTKTLTSEKSMQEHYDNAMKLLDKMITELSK